VCVLGVGGFFEDNGDAGPLLAKGTKANDRTALLASEGLNGPLSSTAKGTKCHKRRRLDLVLMIPASYSSVDSNTIYHCYAQTFRIP